MSSTLCCIQVYQDSVYQGLNQTGLTHFIHQSNVVSKPHLGLQAPQLATVIEVGLKDGQEVIAAYDNGLSSYITSTGKSTFKMSTNASEARFGQDLLKKSRTLIHSCNLRKRLPETATPTGLIRISVYNQGAIYLKEGPFEVLYTHPLMGQLIYSAFELMNYLSSFEFYIAKK